VWTDRTFDDLKRDRAEHAATDIVGSLYRPAFAARGADALPELFARTREVVVGWS